MSTNPTQIKVDPVTRVANFNQLTREHWQMMPAVSGAVSSRISFDLPRARLLKKLQLMVTATLTATHASETTYTPHTEAPYNFITRLQLKANNGFSLYDISGRAMYFYNYLRERGDSMARAASGRGKVVQGVTASSGGTANTVRMVIDLPIMINDRDPLGLILLQNPETTLSCIIDFGALADLVPAASGYTFAVASIVVTPMVETFSVPGIEKAYPDLGMVKLVRSQQFSVAGSGVQINKLVTGNIVRKLAWFIETAAGVGVTDASLTNNFEVVLNTADKPYEIEPRILAALNQDRYGVALPQGLWAMDFSYQGVSGLGNARDYVDTEQLTEFWLRWTAAVAGNITVITEELSQVL